MSSSSPIWDSRKYLLQIIVKRSTESLWSDEGESKKLAKRRKEIVASCGAVTEATKHKTFSLHVRPTQNATQN